MRARVLVATVVIAAASCASPDTEVRSVAALDGGTSPAPSVDASSSDVIRERAFTKHTLDAAFRGEGVAAFDVNGDGRIDVVTEQYWYEAPAWTAHEISEPKTYEPISEYSTSFACFGMDVDRDGKTDLLVVPFPGAPMYWLRNPGAQSGRWERHLVVKSAATETPVFDERTNRLYLGIEPERVLAWLEPDPADATAAWLVHVIGPPDDPLAATFHHGLGFGDVNGDGRDDVLTTQGWYEGPTDPRATPWTFHAAPLAENDCAQLYAFDVNGDGRADILCSSPHHYGVRWFEQTEDGQFALHLIDESFSESHAMRFEDLDGDGIPEIVTGKRVYSHGLSEEGASDPARLLYFSLAARDANPRWVRHDIDDASGVGTAFEVRDVDGDGRLDIVTNNKKGLHLFTTEAR